MKASKIVLRTAFVLLIIFGISVNANAASWVSVSKIDVPSTVNFDKSFTINFSLKEVKGSSKTFEKVAVAILKDNKFIFDFAMYSNVKVSGKTTWSKSVSNKIYAKSDRPDGTYKIVIRGKLKGDNWFDFDTTGSGVNPKYFKVIRSASNTGGGSDKAGWVSETILDNTKYNGGSSFKKTWKIKNTGTSTWTSSYKLKYSSNQGGRLSSISEVKISGSVKPGQSYTFTVPMKAPAAQSSEKTYREDWKLTNSSGSTIKVGNSSTIWALIKVHPKDGGSSSSNASKGLKNASNNLNKKSGKVTWNGKTTTGIWADSKYTYCARFTRMCYGELGRFGDAISMYNYFNGKKLINKGTNPPAGAVVFYAKHSENVNYGHTGIAVGNGKLYSVTSRSTGVNLTPVIKHFKAAYLGYVTADTFIKYH